MKTAGLQGPHLLGIGVWLGRNEDAGFEFTQRTWASQCRGLDEHSALQAALHTFGAARQVQRGFGRVYLAPTALRWATLVGMFAATAVLPP